MKNLSRRSVVTGIAASIAMPAIVRAQIVETWTKPAAPILTATQAWEQGSCQQPWIVYEGNSFFRMWYTGGWANPGIGYAECNGDPTNPANWTKPNSAAWWPSVDFNAVVKHNGLYYVFLLYQNNIYVAWSPDPRAPAGEWLDNRIILSAGAASALDAKICGPSPVFDGDEFDLFYCGVPSSPPVIYRQFLARMTMNAVSGGVLSKDLHSPLTSLQIQSGEYGITGNIQKVGSNWNVWMHASTSGVLPCDIYHFYSPDKINWTVLNGGQPVISRAMLWNPSGFDQVADCCVVECTDLGTTYAFFDCVNNTTGTACLAVSSIAAPLSTICP